jgi:hypothetical protein
MVGRLKTKPAYGMIVEAMGKRCIMCLNDPAGLPDNKEYQQKVLTNIEKLNENTGPSPEFVASIIYKAATDNKKKLKYLADKDISLFAKVRKILPDSLFMKVVKNKLEK